MSSPLQRDPGVDPAQLEDCWNRIGVRGDRSCPELSQHLHCRNCPVDGNAALTLLHAPLPPGYREAAIEALARSDERDREASLSVLTFRIAAEWFAWPTAAIVEIAAPHPIHAVPHRDPELLLGLVNIRGELMICVSVGKLLGLDLTPPQRSPERGLVLPRLLIAQGSGGRLAFPVDEVDRTLRIHESQLCDVPSSVARCQAKYTHSLFSWRERSIGFLDDRLLLYALERGLG